jgi:methyltransferase (TIGR00027 family)
VTRAASRTAVLVCQARAVAHGRLAPGRFDDPAALPLLLPDERAPVERARTGVPPDGWGPRTDYEMLVADAHVMVPRTVAIDDAVREAAHPQVVILGAGLDGRAWRIPELAAAEVFEVDHPASQRDKRERARAAALAPVAGSVGFVPVDLSRDPLGPALAAAGHRTGAPTTWVWEGVVSYLTRTEAESTVAAVAERSAPGSRLVLAYLAPSLQGRAGRVLARAMARVGGGSDPTAREPQRSSWTPTAVADLLARHGLRVERDGDLDALAGGLDLSTRRGGFRRSGRIAVAGVRRPAHLT